MVECQFESGGRFRGRTKGGKVNFVRRLGLGLCLGSLGFWSGCVTPSASGPHSEPQIWVSANDPRISYFGGVRKVISTEGAVTFDRVLDTPGRGFRWDSPGARMCWRSDSRSLVLVLRYTARHTGSSRNSEGFLRVDGQDSSPLAVSRPDDREGLVEVEVPVPGEGGMHDYEWIFPYGDSVEILGLKASEEARWEPTQLERPVRYLAFGDSVTQGFTATSVLSTYAFLLAEAKGWELVNLGIGGRGTAAADSAVITEVDADVVSVLIGVNDWQGGGDLEQYRANLEGLLSGIRRGLPDAPIVVITPLWVPESWSPESVRFPLESYREVVRSVVAALDDERIHLVHGPELIDHDPANFDRVAVHPNDAGFTQMADRLGDLLAVWGIGRP